MDQRRVLNAMVPAGAPILTPETADYSFAVEYNGPALPYEIPRAVPIEIEQIPLAAVVPPSSLKDPLSVPVVHPLPSPSPLKKSLRDVPLSVEMAVASPTSVIENHAEMYDVSGEVGSSGLLGSSGCPDVSAELSEVNDISGAVVFSDELMEGEEGSSNDTAPARLSMESALSSEFDFQSAEDDNDDEAIATENKKALVTFQDFGGESSCFASPERGDTPSEHLESSEEAELKIKKGACRRCLKGSRFTEKETCLACDAKYCSVCLLRAMGSMPEGRKCLSCIGAPILETKREKLGKSSRMLKKLLSSLEVQMVMKAEKSCEANQLRPEDICVNGKKLGQEEMVLLQTCPCPPSKLKPGFYWYDKVSGFWGKVGHKPDKIITPHLNVGGNLMPNASNGNTGILINGREITKSELRMLKWAGVQCAGNPHFWVNADGTYQEEGQKNIKGQIWGKPIMKLLCPVLSLPIPSKDANPSGEEVDNMARRIVPEYFEHRAIQKLLLVGYHRSGTSTIYKQAKFLYRNASFSEDERQDIKLIIQSCIYCYLVILLEGRERFEEESLAEERKNKQLCSSGDVATDKSNGVTKYSVGPRLKAFSDWLLKIMASGNLEEIFPAASREYAPLVQELWNDPAIQATYSRRSELPSLSSAASYFLEQVVDISRVEYEPSDMDILYADGLTPSNGLACTDFIFPQLECIGRCVDDVDQQDMLQRYQLIRIHSKGLGENCKWLIMFEDVRLVIFCVALSDYDVYHEDINGVITNRMMESKRLFESIASHPAFYEKDFLLILNKFDLLDQKIDTAPLTLCEWFADFNPVVSQHQSKNSNSNLNMSATMSQQVFHYIAVKFKRLFFSITGRKLYVSLANGLHSDSVDAALRYAREIMKWEEERPVFGESVYSTDPNSFSPSPLHEEIQL